MFSTEICRFWIDSRSRSASRASAIVDLLLVEARVGQDLAQRAFEFAHVGAHVLGDEEGHFLGHLGAFGARLVDQDRHAHLELGRLDRHRQAGIEARTSRSWMSASPLG